MLVVFDAVSDDALAMFLAIASDPSPLPNEDYEFCVAREKAQEILACRELGIPYVVLAHQYVSAAVNPVASVIDTNVDLDSMGSDTRLVGRTLVNLRQEPILERFSHYLDDTHLQNVSSWPKTVRNADKYLKRTIAQLTQSEFNAAMRRGSIQTPVFIKGVEKGGGLSLRHVVTTPDELKALVKPTSELRNIYGMRVPPHLKDQDFVAAAKGPDWFCEYREQMQSGRVRFFNPVAGVILSEVLEFQHHPDHKAEYRCFIVDGRVTSISTYTDYTAHPVPDEIRSMAEAFAADYADLAPGFVADFGMTDRGPVLVELNDITQSGRYVGNDPKALFSALRSQLSPSPVAIIEPIVRNPAMS